MPVVAPVSMLTESVRSLNPPGQFGSSISVSPGQLIDLRTILPPAGGSASTTGGLIDFPGTLRATVDAPRWGLITTTPRIPTKARAEASDTLKAAPELAASDRDREADPRRLEAELEETRAERGQALERLSAERVASQGHRMRLERELADARAAHTQEIQEVETRRDELVAAITECKRLRAELSAVRAAAAGERERISEQSQAALFASTSERERLQTQLSVREEELQTVVRNLVAIEGATASLERAFAELRSEAHELRAERSSLAERIDLLSLHNEGLHQALAERDRGDGALRSTISTLEQELARRRARIGELQNTAERADAELESSAAGRASVELRISELERERERTVEDLRRVASSRAWRWGHGTTRLLRRLTFRRSLRSAGAVEKLLDRLDPPPAVPADASASAESEPSKS
jgi:septal ring factor EnvC (AmiA/AmiB activator)